jgi:putative tryptophan/tyrosine transport system substrate-binding protein
VRQALVGYVSVDALTIDERHADGQDERLPSLASELVKLRPDVIFAVGAAAVRAARQAGGAVPIVALTPRAPDVETGRASSETPRNVTGVIFESPQLSRRRLELLREIVPGVKRVAVLAHPGDAPSALSLRETQAAAEGLGVAVVAVEARDAEGLARALGALGEPRPGALIVPGSATAFRQRDQIVGVTTRAKLPAMFAHREFVDAGGLASYGPNLDALYRRAGTLLGKALIGVPPRDLPLEAPSRFELVVSRKTARAFGFDVPSSVVNRADEVR